MKSTEKRCVDGRHAILRQGSNSRTVSTLVLVSTREVSERIARGAGVQGRRIAETSSWQVDRNLPNNLEKELRISDCKGSEELGVHLIQIGPFPGIKPRMSYLYKIYDLDLQINSKKME